MVPVDPDLGKTGRGQGGRGERRSGGGDGVFSPLAELLVVRVRPERHRPSLFIGRQWRFRRRDIFPRRELINSRAHSYESLRRFATVRPYPCTAEKAWRIPMAVWLGAAMAPRVEGATVRWREEGRSIYGAEKLRESVPKHIHLALGWSRAWCRRHGRGGCHDMVFPSSGGRRWR
jgi:hypothetical protein